MADGSTPVERYLAHLDRLSGGVEPRYLPVESSRADTKGLTAIFYRDLPEPGTSIGFTYGLSRDGMPQWTLGRPELCVCVDSDDPTWILAATFLAERLRGTCPFSYGDLLDLGEPIAAGSTMDGFVVFGPAAIDPDDARIDVGADLPINLVGLYPTHRSERAFIEQRGLRAFWDLEWDPYDVTRPPAA